MTMELIKEWMPIGISLLPLSLLTLGALFIMYMTRNNNYWKRRGVPYIKPKPILGSSLDILTGKTLLGEYFRKVYEDYKEPFVGFFFLDQPCLVIRDLNIIRDILVTDFEHFQNRSAVVNLKKDPMGSRMVFFSLIPTWKNQRKNLSPVFSSGKLKSQFSCLESNATQLSCAIKKKLMEGENKIGFKKMASRYTVNGITSAFYGLNSNTFVDENGLFMQITERVLNFSSVWYAFQNVCMYAATPVYHLFGMNFIDAFSTNFFRQLTRDILSEREKTHATRGDLVDVLLSLKRKENITDLKSPEGECISALVTQVFAAGYETSSSTMSFALFELAKNPQCQSIARKEVIAIKEAHGEFTYTNVTDMKYLKNCILETLRMYPSVPFLDRRCTKDYKIPGTEVVVKKGQAIYISNWGIQNDPEYYPNPSVFDPTRFNEEIARDRPECTYMAFGAGPKYCAGKRFAIVNVLLGMANILLNYEVRLPEGDPKTIELTPMGFLLQPRQLYLKCVEIQPSMGG